MTSRLGVAHLLLRDAASLSGGERKRMALAGALLSVKIYTTLLIHYYATTQLYSTTVLLFYYKAVLYYYTTTPLYSPHPPSHPSSPPYLSHRSRRSFCWTSRPTTSTPTMGPT